jgi:hypothetical protein
MAAIGKKLQPTKFELEVAWQLGRSRHMSYRGNVN